MKSIISEIPGRRGFFRGEKTLEIGYPWLSYGAIIALESLVNKSAKVLEFGSGGSTIFWAKNCKNLKSFETNPEWYSLVKNHLKEFTNVEMLLANERQILEAIAKEPDSHFDFILVDSEPKDVRRILVANACVPKVKIGGFLILDNYNGFGMENFVYPPGFEIYTFDEFHYSGRGTRLCRKT